MWPRTAVPIIKLADELIVPSPYLVEVFSKYGLRAYAISNILDRAIQVSRAADHCARSFCRTAISILCTTWLVF